MGGFPPPPPTLFSVLSWIAPPSPSVRTPRHPNAHLYESLRSLVQTFNGYFLEADPCPGPCLRKGGEAAHGGKAGSVTAQNPVVSHPTAGCSWCCCSCCYCCCFCSLALWQSGMYMIFLDRFRSDKYRYFVECLHLYSSAWRRFLRGCVSTGFIFLPAGADSPQSFGKLLAVSYLQRLRHGPIRRPGSVHKSFGSRIPLRVRKSLLARI